MLSFTVGLIAAFLAGTNAHMFISSPSPIAGTAPKDPLPSTGPGFPCHGVPLPSSGGQKMAAGSSQLLSFDLGGGLNTAVHGGGSCQISITYETDAEKVKDPKNWYVIHSIEDGCPSNTAGNLDGSYQGPKGPYTGAIACSDPRANGIDCVNEFHFTIPKGVKDGNAIMAWTWYNTIGNRELYMNCANTYLTGGDGSEMSSFPTMFVANAESANPDTASCRTIEQQNVKFPYPGKYLTLHPTMEAGATNYSTEVPNDAKCASLGAPANGNGAAPPFYGSGKTSAAPSSAVASSPASGSATPPAYAVPSSGAAGSGLVTVTTMQTVTSGAASASARASSAPAASGSAPAAPSSYAPVPTGSSPSPGNGSCPANSVACANPGGVVCIGASRWGLCDINNCAVSQALAAGTHCSGGKVLKRDHVRRHMGKHLRRDF